MLDYYLISIHWCPHSGVAKYITKKGVKNIGIYIDLFKYLVSLILEFKYTKQLLVSGSIYINILSTAMS